MICSCSIDISNYDAEPYCFTIKSTITRDVACYMDKVISKMLDFANKDIIAKHLLGMSGSIEIICYHSEQAAEEVVKVFLYTIMLNRPDLRLKCYAVCAWILTKL